MASQGSGQDVITGDNVDQNFDNYTVEYTRDETKMYFHGETCLDVMVSLQVTPMVPSICADIWTRGHRCVLAFTQDKARQDLHGCLVDVRVVRITESNPYQMNDHLRSDSIDMRQ